MRVMLEPPIFSIVTICFNDLENLKRTAHSIENIKSDDYEWIVVDGGSVDGTLEYLKSCKLINHFISEPDSGISDAWNKGIKTATGDYVLILNSGDIYYSDFIVDLKKFLNQDKIICSNSYYVNRKFEKIGTFWASPSKLIYGMYLPHNWAAVPRKYYELYGLYKNYKYSMDYEWFLRYYKVFGADGFVVTNIIGGEYLIGGYSDKTCIEGFKMNMKIQIALGYSKFISVTHFMLKSLVSSLSRFLK